MKYTYTFEVRANLNWLPPAAEMMESINKSMQESGYEEKIVITSVIAKPELTVHDRELTAAELEKIKSFMLEEYSKGFKNVSVKLL